jgi:DNA helicase-2/ATP-dependent DNA helicase PcrA
MQYSKFQLAIFEFFKNESGHAIVQARAGSGKTFTIKEGTKLFDPTLRILRVAFNKHIADVLKVGAPPNTTDITTNAFGWRICTSNVRNLSRKVDPQKTESILKSMYDMDDKDERRLYYKEKGSINRLVSLFKANCIFTPPTDSQILETADRYGLDINQTPDFLERIRTTYNKAITFTSIMDFDDQIFMPVFLNLPIPQYDVVIVDEAQDLNPIQQELLIKAGKRIIAVGDDRQAIYGFRGADPESMNNLQKRLNAITLPLSICYRCPKKIVELAQQIVPDIEPAPDAPDGVVSTVKIDRFKSEAADGDYVLCRTTAPLVSTCLQFIREGRKATVRGRDIGQQLLQLVSRISDSDAEPIEIFRDKLNNYRMEQLERLQRAEREAEIIALNDRVDTILVLVERSKMVGDIKTEVEGIFKDEKILSDGTVIRVPGIVFCTVHRSKGLEAKRIWILKQELMPHPAAKKPEQQVQEMNLKYVAETRSLGELYWVTE